MDQTTDTAFEKTGMFDCAGKEILCGDMLSDGDGGVFIVLFTHGAFGTIPQESYPYVRETFYKPENTFVPLFDHDLSSFIVVGNVKKYESWQIADKLKAASEIILECMRNLTDSGFDEDRGRLGLIRDDLQNLRSKLYGKKNHEQND